MSVEPKVVFSDTARSCCENITLVCSPPDHGIKQNMSVRPSKEQPGGLSSLARSAASRVAFIHSNYNFLGHFRSAEV